MYAANQRNTFMVITLFITIAALKHFETLDTAVYMLYEYTKLR